MDTLLEPEHGHTELSNCDLSVLMSVICVYLYGYDLRQPLHSHTPWMLSSASGLAMPTLISSTKFQSENRNESSDLL